MYVYEQQARTESRAAFYPMGGITPGEDVLGSFRAPIIGSTLRQIFESAAGRAYAAKRPDSRGLRSVVEVQIKIPDRLVALAGCALQP
ncbi:MAG: hypothetical protein ABSF53_24660, partial [Terracidiphilus sp.]